MKKTVETVGEWRNFSCLRWRTVGQTGQTGQTDRLVPSCMLAYACPLYLFLPSLPHLLLPCPCWETVETVKMCLYACIY